MNTIRIGSRGSDVVVWQKIIGVTADGAFGPKTDAATREWQRARGLVVDGIVGPKTWAMALAPKDAAPMLRGLDAYAGQGALDYAALRREYDARFVILKAQQGNDGFDPMFERNWKAAVDAGFEPFPYCFLYPLDKIDPAAQAKRFVDEVFKRVPGARGRPFFLDVEWPEVVPLKPGPGSKGWKEWGCTPKSIAQYTRAVCEGMTAHSGRKPSIYIYDWWWTAVRDGAPTYGFPEKGDVSWASDYDLWMAWYRSGWPVPGDHPKVPGPFTDWKFWQFDGNGGLRLPNGVDADFCVFNGGEGELRAFAEGP